MSGKTDLFYILVACGDPAQQEKLRQALMQGELGKDVHFVGNGPELVETLELLSNSRSRLLLPSLILMDMGPTPQEDLKALLFTKGNDKLRRIPVVVLTSSVSREEVLSLYDLGANSLIPKPEGLEELARIMEVLRDYWKLTVALPSHPSGPA